MSPAPMTGEDAEAWARLIAAARTQSHHPHDHVPALAKASRRGPVIPLGHRDKDSCFVGLFRLAQSFPGLGADRRAEAAAELGRFAGQCAEILKAIAEADGRPRGWAARRDVFD